ncbi:hypothetical protein CRUP_029916, partial [Coryphaenoides rupestris]
MADLQAISASLPVPSTKTMTKMNLREAVQDPSVKPKLQCLMVDPSFSMVTVQSEDSGIVWETASSRCSTPWASETSSISEGYSMDGSGTQGQITIVFDEEQIVRRRIRGGETGDGEVSVPNIKQEKTQGEPDLDEIKDKDQQLFSLISEGYEILNIRVPSKLPTAVEQDSTDSAFGNAKAKRNSTCDVDYFEKFTLLDVVVPSQQAPESQQEANVPGAKPRDDEETPGQETSTDSPAASDESFVFVTDIEIAGDHLDEVFYGNEAHEALDDTLQKSEEAEMESAEKLR